jgi:hypothetical protein
LIPFNSVGGYSTGLTRTTVITDSGGICASGGTFANLNVVSGLTNVSPLTITASSLADGVGILRLTGSEPDINLNDTDGGFNTLTFENAGNARVAIGRNSNNEFYLAVRDPAISGGAYKDNVIVANSSTGIVNLGYGLCASGGITFSGPVEFDSLARFDGGLCAGSGVTFSSGFGATGNIFLHGAQIGSTLGTAPKFFARAWVNFDGDPVAIRSSGNVSSITDNGVGLYTVNFATSMGNTGYCPLITVKAEAGIGPGRPVGAVRNAAYATAVTTSALQIVTAAGFAAAAAGVTADFDMINVAIFN